jgi:hypothetical protein
MNIGILGHRFIGDQRVTTFVSYECKRILERLLDEHPNLVALSATAEGSDTIFAEAALSLGVPLKIIRPFDTYCLDFAELETLERYKIIRTKAKTEVRLRYVDRSSEAYAAAMTWIVMNSDLLVAVWDGFHTNTIGGTSYSINKAIEYDRHWIHINPSDLSISHYPSQKMLNRK